MTSLSTLFGGGGGDAADPLIEGLPTVCVYGGDFNQHFDVRVHRVHSGELIGAPWAAITNSTASYAHGMSHLQEFGYSSDRGNFNSQISSQGYTTYPNFTQSLLQNDHYPYAWFGSCSQDGRIGFHSFHGSSFLQKFYYRINVQSLRGRRPRRQFTLYNYKFSETGMQSDHALKSQVDVDTYIDITGHVTNNNGCCVYKQDTKQLLMYYPTSTGATTGYFHLVQGTVDLMGVSHVKDFFDTATFKKFYANSGTTNVAHSSINYHIAMVIGDNNTIAIQWRNGNTHHYRTFDLDVADGSNVAAVIDTSMGNTTSYGTSQGLMYQERYQQTWDGTWGAFYTPYYYYACGISCFFMSIANPNKYYKFNNTLSSAGGALIPSDQKGFKWLTGVNTDSQPIQGWGVNFDSIASPSDNAVSELIAVDSVAATDNFATVANGAALNNSYGANSFEFPGYYYSTSYPRFMTVNWWQQDGAYIK